MNNKGFTLIELLAVIVVLVSISLVAVSGISASLERREVKDCEEQKEMAKNAAKIYFSLNEGNEVSINDLISGNYLDSSKIEKLSISDKISIDSDEGYVYSGTICS